MSEENISEVVQVRMKEETLQQLDKLKVVVKSPSRSDAVRRSVQLTDLLINAILKGNRILIEDNRGKQSQIMIPGLNYE